MRYSHRIPPGSGPWKATSPEAPSIPTTSSMCATTWSPSAGTSSRPHRCFRMRWPPGPAKNTNRPTVRLPAETYELARRRAADPAAGIDHHQFLDRLDARSRGAGFHDRGTHAGHLVLWLGGRDPLALCQLAGYRAFLRLPDGVLCRADPGVGVGPPAGAIYQSGRPVVCGPRPGSGF